MEGTKRSHEAGPSSVTIDKTKQQITQKSTHTFHDSSDEDEEEIIDHSKKGVFVPGPLLSLKEQIEKDKEDESLRRWKEKLLGCLESDLDGQLDPEVKFHSIGILSEDFGEIVTPLPVEESQNGSTLFTLREGSRYQLKLQFSVMHNLVSGLTYSNTVWKGGLQVDQSKGMLGTFAPQKEPYVYALKEDTTPSGALARGVYSAKLKFEDDDKRCHMELKYLFEIKKSG
ncbi:rho GDP-dissociation inhibitor [Trifolium repens]|nr:rho GDP-dissociation inhibitor [Trifolium repens]